MPSLFDLLPAEALEGVLRATSTRPNAADWALHADAHAVLYVLTRSGGVQHGLRSLFPVVELCSSAPRTRLGLVVLTGGGGGAAAGAFPFARLVRALGDALQELRVLAPAAAALHWRWRRAVLAHAGGVRRLALRGPGMPVSDVLRARGRGLDALELGVREIDAAQLAAVAAHCPALRELSLEAETCASGLDFAPLCAALGPRLRALAFALTRPAQPAAECRAALIAVAEHCGGLRCLALRGFPRDVQDEVAGVCAAIAPALRDLALAECGLEAPAAEAIRAACPRARFDVEEALGCPAATLRAMGPAARHVNLGAGSVTPLWSVAQWRAVSALCENVEAVTVLNSSFAHIDFRAFFHAPKRRLREFRAGFPARDVADLLMRDVAARVTSLERLEVSCVPSAPVLEEVVRANPRLANVVLVSMLPGYCTCNAIDGNGIWRGLREENWTGLVPLFLKCGQQLQELDLSCGAAVVKGKVPALAEACHEARGRRISVRVCDVQYL